MSRYRSYLTDRQKPMTIEDMEAEIAFQSHIGSVRDPHNEFSDDTVTKVLTAIGLGENIVKSEDNARSNTNTKPDA